VAETYAYRQVRVKQTRVARKNAGQARVENPGQENLIEARDLMGVSNL
jgi:hypothetical protein